ncbi:hypothetical protein ACFWUT_25510 [Streptomyces cyaneofuscatus]|uniref:hypothetical protein n=1 Tax=Streptomyces cyaneofuscatus TaxID=66883 RepID=UPI00365D9F7B
MRQDDVGDAVGDRPLHIGTARDPISDGLERLVKNAVEQVVTSGAFEAVWVDANRRAHSAMDKALTGRSDTAVELKDDEVVIDLGPVVAQVKDRLVKAGFSPAAKIPTVHTDFVVFASEDVGKVRTSVRVPELLGGWLPVIPLLVAAAGVYVAFHRRYAVVGAGLAVFVAMVVLGIGLTVARDVHLDHLPPGASQAATGTVYDALVKFLRVGVRALAATALLTAAGALLRRPVPHRRPHTDRLPKGYRRLARRGDIGRTPPRSGRSVRAPFQALDRGGRPAGRRRGPVHLELPDDGGRGVDAGDRLGGPGDPRIPGRRSLTARRLPDQFRHH